MKDYNKGLNLIENLIAKKWIPEIINSLEEGNKLYCDILSSIDFLSTTELQRKLKILEKYKCITKENNNYELTKLGHEINHIFNHIYELSEKYL